MIQYAQNKLEKSVCRLQKFCIQLLSCWENFLPRLDAEISNEKKKAVTSAYYAFLTADPFPTLLNKLTFLSNKKGSETDPILFALKKISVMHVIKLGFAPVSFPPG